MSQLLQHTKTNKLMDTSLSHSSIPCRQLLSRKLKKLCFLLVRLNVNLSEVVLLLLNIEMIYLFSQELQFQRNERIWGKDFKVDKKVFNESLILSWFKSVFFSSLMATQIEVNVTWAFWTTKRGHYHVNLNNLQFGTNNDRGQVICVSDRVMSKGKILKQRFYYTFSTTCDRYSIYTTSHLETGVHVPLNCCFTRSRYIIIIMFLSNRSGFISSK